MSLSSTTTTPPPSRSMHTILGGGIRYETVELILTTIPNFQLKQKGRILHLFTEVSRDLQRTQRHVFMQEIQEALDERQNQFDSILVHNQANHLLEQPFAFESQIDTDLNPVDLSLKSSNEADSHVSKETLPSLAAPDKTNSTPQRRAYRTSNKETPDVKMEAVTPPRPKSRLSKSKGKTFSGDPPLRQMTMTQLFDPIETPKPAKRSNSVKQEPTTPSDDTSMFMPESLIGLAQRSESISNTDNEQSDLISPGVENNIFNLQSLKRKRIPSPIVDDNISDSPTTDEDDVQNEALLQSPSANIDNEELLYACAMCRNYWLGLPAELRRKENLTCRHRQRPAVQTPEHFWSLGIPSTQTCIQRGYGGVLPPEKPIERPRRPRRQYHRRLQQRQDQEQNDDSQ